MEQYVIKGGNPLNGEVEIGGAKNAALAILAAAIMTDETVRTSRTKNPARITAATACGAGPPGKGRAAVSWACGGCRA